MESSKQQPPLKHWSGLMPGKPQFSRFSGSFREHWQAAGGEGEQRQATPQPHPGALAQGALGTALM